MNKQTLAERIAEAIQYSGKLNKHIAVECGVTPAAVTGWLNGDIQSLKSRSAALLGAATGYRTEWIVFGSGPRMLDDENASDQHESPKTLSSQGDLPSLSHLVMALSLASQLLDELEPQMTERQRTLAALVTEELA
jgi:hypothetical protein